jgi:replicative DNA helicase
MGAMGGDVIVIAGRAGMGKSWLLNEIGYKQWLAGNSVLVVTMEMGKRQFVRRWMGRHLGINPNFIRSGQLSHWAEQRLRESPETVLQMPGVYVVSGDMEKHVEGVESVVAETTPDVILVDAAYLLTIEGRRSNGISKWERIGEVIAQLKKMAIRYDRPVIITVQFNRNQKSNTRREMDLGDIAGSDSIPQDASVVLGVRKGQPPYDSIRREVEVLKNREGEVGKFEVNFRFTPPNMEEQLPNESATDNTLAGWMV